MRILWNVNYQSNMNRIGRVYKYNLNYDYESGR